ncbi:unnamed protein product [Vicia faba]|uniref:Protein kinase domain-containing protein n=1 Tax=Vicia faba TaxID=3906 RepID=A0AAV1AYM8_VICFA|nr:unnamed protein product [Vicia faba]
MIYKATIVEWEAFTNFSRNNLLETSKRQELLKTRVYEFGGLEFVFFIVVGVCLNKTKKKSSGNQNSYHHAILGFRRYSYYELKVATNNFSNEIGRGGGGVVYRGKHRILVYEYMENGSLAENLSSKTNTLDWSKRYDIALGISRVLAYLHEECLEWILDCDIKPQNILLDSNFQPKLAYFGLSKLKNRNDLNNNSKFSMIRGTRGYMAPEWIFHLPITSKVDVYSYGIVVLEMITGKNPTLMNIEGEDGEMTYNGSLISWVREKKRSQCWVEEILDPAIGTSCDLSKMDILVRVALECVEEDMDIRPNMSQVVEMLQNNERVVE